MSEEQAQVAKIKPSRGHYYVVYKDGGSVKTEEFKAKRSMYDFLKDMPQNQVIEIFKGRRLEMHVKQVYQVD
jgi:hypothetical protein